MRKGLRLLSSEVDERIDIQKNDSITEDGVNGFMKFGEHNDYPDVLDKLINGSVTAKSVAKMYAKFLTGGGFTNKVLNTIVVGRKSNGKELNLISLVRQINASISKFNGYYIHVNRNKLGESGTVSFLPFKNMRLGSPDQSGYTAKAVKSSNFNDTDNITKYHVFSNNLDIIKAQYSDENKFKGQVYYEFLDEDYFYPLSPFDASYLDCDNENQISLFRNRQLRNGFLNKIIFRIATPNEEERFDDDGNLIDSPEYSKQNDLATELVDMMGVDGKSALVVGDDIDSLTGDVKDSGNLKIDEIKSNIDSKLFENWESRISNNIRKSVQGMPAILIDYEQNKLGTTSGEAIKQAVLFYNKLILDDQQRVTETLSEIFRNTSIKELKGVTDFRLTKISLTENDIKEIANLKE